MNFPIQQSMKFLNVLLIGQASSGKSSFINTCATALLDENRIVTKVAVLEPMSSGVTTDVSRKLKVLEITDSIAYTSPLSSFACKCEDNES